MFKWFADVFDVTLLATIGLHLFATLVGACVRPAARPVPGRPLSATT